MSTSYEGGYREELSRLTPGLRQFARALVWDHNPEAADDLVQTTLVRALGSDQKRSGDRLLIWLLAILVEAHRRRAAEVSADHKVNVGGQGGGRSHGWDVARNASSSASLLGTLPLEGRESFLLITLLRLTYAQAAETLGVSIGTVVARLIRARDALSRAENEGALAPLKAARPQKATAPYLRVVK
jgi:RNA polymerase sigma-70 factor, ECF subfamily